MTDSTNRSSNLDPQPLLSSRNARRLVVLIFAGLILSQIGLLALFGNRVSRFDGYDEADAIRSAEAYAKDGLTSHYGLPRILYGDKFPKVGAITDHLEPDGTVKAHHRIGFPESLTDRQNWVYTHYPPGPNLFCGLLAKIFGHDRILLWRLAPITLALIAWVIFCRTLIGLFGRDRGALILAACAWTPMAICYMPGLHFEGYTLTLLLLQLCVLLRWLWGGSVKLMGALAALFGLGFLQGWISFDHFFIVSLAAVPLWLLRRNEAPAAPVSQLFWMVAMPCAGFGFAHFLHLLQIAGELGGLMPAISELTHTAVARTSVTPGQEGFSFARSFAKMAYLYLRDFLRLYNPHFGPLLFCATLLGGWLAVFRRTEVTTWWRREHGRVVLQVSGGRGVGMVLLAAFFVSGVWSAVMPAATVGNFHIWPRIFFYFYFVLVLVIVRSISFARPEDGRSSR